MDIICGCAEIKDMQGAGFENFLLDFSLFCSPQELENYGIRMASEENKTFVSECPSELCVHIKPLLGQCRDAGLRMPVARAPYLLRHTKRKDLDSLLFRLAQESIRSCGKAGCFAVIVRPVFSGVRPGDEWKVNREFYLGLADAAKECRMMILLENQCRDINGHLVRGVCSDAEEAALWIDRLNAETGEERFGFCMDVGVCSLCGQNMRDFALTLGDRLKTVILRDGYGCCESSLLPFTAVERGQSRTDWLNLIRGLRETEFDGQLVIDAADTVSAFPLSLRREVIKLARKAADYFQWQIGQEAVLKKYNAIVLFGAGNMCRAYMKCYGEKYPPLFTCDNNRKLWGSSFCGLQVEPPERLKDLPDGCVILICNIYYREITEQLRAMGVKNPVEYFNDEYMPAYHFERLEMWRPD